MTNPAIDPKGLECAARAVAEKTDPHFDDPIDFARAALDAYHKHLAEAGLVIVPAAKD